MRPLDGTFFLPGPVGRVEAVRKRHPSPRAAAVVCHPPPHAGGTFDNEVVFRATRALHGAEPRCRASIFVASRRTSHFDEGVGEADDTRAALDFLACGVFLWRLGGPVRRRDAGDFARLRGLEVLVGAHEDADRIREAAVDPKRVLS